MSLSYIQAASTICFKPFRLDEAAAGLAAAGFSNVELSAVKGSVEHLQPDNLSSREVGRAQQILERNGQRAVSVAGHGVLHTAEGFERHRRVLHAAAELSATSMLTFADRVGSGDWSAFRQHMARLVGEASEFGIVVCVENHNRRFATAAALRLLAADIGHPALRLNYDTGNASFLAGVRPAQDVRDILDLLGHVHLKDHRGGAGMLDFPALGEGDLDLEDLLTTLTASGFEGPVSLEIVFDATWPDWEACVSAARRSKACWDAFEVGRLP